MTLVALIPARGGSKEIPRKNIRQFCGKPLVQWTIDVALASPSVDRLVVSTDDPEIADICRAGGAEVPFLRPPELATDTAPGMASVVHALQLIPEASDVLLLQPTSPLRHVMDIEGIINMYRLLGCDSAVSVAPCSKHPAWMFSLSQEQLLERIVAFPDSACRQQLPPAYSLNGALYLASRSHLECNKGFLTSKTLGYVMPTERSVDIDSMLDWKWAEFLMKQSQ